MTPKYHYVHNLVNYDHYKCCFIVDINHWIAYRQKQEKRKSMFRIIRDVAVDIHPCLYHNIYFKGLSRFIIFMFWLVTHDSGVMWGEILPTTLIKKSLSISRAESPHPLQFRWFCTCMGKILHLLRRLYSYQSLISIFGFIVWSVEFACIMP